MYYQEDRKAIVKVLKAKKKKKISSKPLISNSDFTCFSNKKGYETGMQAHHLFPRETPGDSGKQTDHSTITKCLPKSTKPQMSPSFVCDRSPLPESGDQKLNDLFQDSG